MCVYVQKEVIQTCSIKSLSCIWVFCCHLTRKNILGSYLLIAFQVSRALVLLLWTYTRWYVFLFVELTISFRKHWYTAVSLIALLRHVLSCLFIRSMHSCLVANKRPKMAHFWTKKRFDLQCGRYISRSWTNKIIAICLSTNTPVLLLE